MMESVFRTKTARIRAMEFMLLDRLELVMSFGWSRLIFGSGSNDCLIVYYEAFLSQPLGK